MYDPTPIAIAGLQPDVKAAAIHLINAYRAAGYPAIISSGRRSLAHNAAIGGAVASRHLVGRAVDIGFLAISSPPLTWLRAGGELWESWGGRWGGRFFSPDPLHFDA